MGLEDHKVTAAEGMPLGNARLLLERYVVEGLRKGSA